MKITSASPYVGTVQSVPFSPIQPPEDKQAFINNLQRRLPPIELLQGAGLDIRVVAVHPDDFPAYCQKNAWQLKDAQALWDGSSDKRQRGAGAARGLAQRPQLWRVREREGDFLAFCVAPSREAASHWASMLDQLLRCHRVKLALTTHYHEGSCKRYVARALEASRLAECIQRITAISVAKPILMMGYTGLVQELLSCEQPPSQTVKLPPYFRCAVWSADGRIPLIALQVFFSLRGQMGAELAAQLRDKLSGLIYVSKVISRYDKHFSACVMPSRFLIKTPEARGIRELEGTRALVPSMQQRTALLTTPTTLNSQALLCEAALRGAPILNNEIASLAEGCGSLPFAAVCQVGPNDKALRACATELLGHLPRLNTVALIKQPSSASKRLEQMYGQPAKILELPKIDAKRHCMGEDLERYVASKAPPKALLGDQAIKVIGVAEEDLAAYAQARGWKLEARIWERSAGEQLLRWGAFMPRKQGNTQRACLTRVCSSDGQDFLLLNTQPSHDLVLHWGLLLSQQSLRVEASFHPGSSQAYARLCVAESQLAARLMDCPELSAKDAVLVLGYSELTAQLLTSEGYQCTSGEERDFHFEPVGSGLSVCVLAQPRQRSLVLVQVDFCYWGELAGSLASALLKLGACSSLVHIAKAGQMAGQMTGQQVYCPRSFSLVTGEQVYQPLDGPELLFSNGLSGDHVSFASPLLETQNAMQEASLQGCASVDVEGAHLARAARGANVSFGALYYASDYVPAGSAPKQSQGLSLISGPEQHDLHKERLVQQAIANYLLPVLKKGA